MLGTLALLIALSPQASPSASPSVRAAAVAQGTPAAQQPPATSTVTVGSAVPAAGDGASVAALVETNRHVTFTVGGAKLRDFTQQMADRRSYDALVVSRSAGSTVIRVQYGVCTSKLEDSAVGENEQPIKLSEHRYVVQRSGTPPTVSVRELSRRAATPARLTVRDSDPSEEESDVSEDVATQVEQDVKELLDGGRWSATLGGKPLTIGQPVALSAEATHALFGEVLPGLSTSKLELTPRAPAADPDRVVFGVVASATMKDGEELPMSSTLDLTGTLELGRADGRLLALELTGPLQFGGSADRERTKIEVVGTGTVTWTYRAQPLAKK